MRVEVKGAKGIVFAKVDTEVVASGVSRLPVEQIKVSFDIKVSEAVSDVIVV